MKYHTTLVSVLVMLMLSMAQRNFGQAISPPKQAQDTESLRQMLRNQPDYTALQHLSISEPHGAVRITSKIARMGTWYREDREDVVVILKAGGPFIRLLPEVKQYEEVQLHPEELRFFEYTPQALAQRNDVVLKYAGTETLDRNKCLKIEVSFKDERLKKTRFVLYVVPELKNLIIRQEIIAEDSRTTIDLSNIQLNVKEKMFQIPPDYKKATK